MTCETKTEGGVTIILCTRGGRTKRPTCSAPNCGRTATALCDFPVAGEKTCSRALCSAHAVKPPRITGIDYCGPHARVHAAMVSA